MVHPHESARPALPIKEYEGWVAVGQAQLGAHLPLRVHHLKPLRPHYLWLSCGIGRRNRR